MSTADRVARLPQWAQHYIARLERERDAAKVELREVLGTSPEETDTVIERGWNQEPIRLPAGSRILFGAGGRSGGIEARWREGSLQVLGLGGPVLIEPYASNHVTVRVGER